MNKKQKWALDAIIRAESTDKCIDHPYHFAGTRGKYTQIIIGGKKHYLHRYILQLEVDMPEGEGVYCCHSCGNSQCCNVKHLYWGNHKTNTEDAVRMNEYARGEQHGKAKLTEAQATAIKNDSRGQKVIADEYNVSTFTIWAIRTGKRWGYLRTGMLQPYFLEEE